MQQTLPNKTANGQYCYEDTYYGQPMDSWVQWCHQDNCVANGWRYTPLARGAFGYDNIVVSLHFLFEEIGVCHDASVEELLLPENQERLADAIHRGWCENYIYWRDNKPKAPYRAPAKPLGDARRNACATETYAELPEDEKEKDQLFVRFVLNRLRDL